jgi:hypothetical protein
LHQLAILGSEIPLPMKKSAILLAAIAFPFSLAFGEVVINEIYGGGGRSGASFDQDFVELFNNGADAVDISEFQLEYARPTRSFRTIATIPAATILGPGEFYVIGGASGANGAGLPDVDFTSSTNLKATAGKVELINSSSTLADLVVYDTTANQHDGRRYRRASARLEIAEMFSLRNTMSDQRIPNGIDTNNHRFDFRTQIPTPDAMNVAVVPEPSTWMMLGVGAAGLIGVQKLRRKHS